MSAPYCRRVGYVGIADVMPAVELALTVHVGLHSGEIDRACGSLATYVIDHALAVDGPIREYYLVGTSGARRSDGRSSTPPDRPTRNAHVRPHLSDDRPLVLGLARTAKRSLVTVGSAKTSDRAARP